MGSASSRAQEQQQQQQQQQQLHYHHQPAPGERPYGTPGFPNNIYPPPPGPGPQQFHGMLPGPGYNPNYAAAQGPTNGQFYGGFPSTTAQYTMPYAPQPRLQFPQQRPAMMPVPASYAPPPVAKAVPMHEYTQTSTIKNQVNLKKHTLKLEPLPDRPYVLSISFSFDASAPCRVSTFLMCTEEPRRACKLTSAQPDSRQPVYFDKGLAIKFPADATTATAHSLDVYQFDTALMSLQTGDNFPLVVRLETLTDEGRAQGHKLEDVECGGAFPMWVQSQTTYARLHKEEDGSWGLVVVKQKVWVQGGSYELQEIYGMEQNRASNVANGLEDIDGRECVICMSAERDTTVVPCRHMCMCNECARALKTQTNKCPICRNEIEYLMHIKIASKPPPAAAAAPAVAAAAPAAPAVAAAGPVAAAAPAAAAAGPLAALAAAV